MKPASLLAADIEAALQGDGRYQQYGHPIQYLCAYKTSKGHVFAVERRGVAQVRLWLPQDEKVRSMVEKKGLIVKKSIAYSDPSNPRKYGRLSSLKRVPELHRATLYSVAITSPADAIDIVSALQ